MVISAESSLPPFSDYKSRRREQVRQNVARHRRLQRLNRGISRPEKQWSLKTPEDFDREARARQIQQCTSRGLNTKVITPRHQDEFFWGPGAHADFLEKTLLRDVPDKSPDRNPHHWIALLAQYTGSEEYLDTAIQALSFRVLARTSTHEKARTWSMSMYGKALKAFRQTLSFPQGTMAMHVFTTGLVLATFELMDLTTAGVARWLSHIAGLGPVVREHAEELSSGTFGQALLRCWRSQLAYAQLLLQRNRVAWLDPDTKEVMQLENSPLQLQHRRLFHMSNNLKDTQVACQDLPNGVTPNSSRELEALCSEIQSEYGLLGYLITVLPKDVFGEDSHVFRPERFLECDSETKREMIRTVEHAFGYGRWMCAGKTVALIELNKIFFELLEAFDIQVVYPGKA